MRRTYTVFAISLVLSLLCACSTSEPSESLAEVPSPSPSVSVAPSPSPSADFLQNKDIYRSFLSENYQKLFDSFSGGISGIGFADLDLDGGMEMIMFDAGASAAMGVQFFDIVDGKVECISANMDAVGKTFGGTHLSSVIVNANHFNDFRLMKDKKTGEKFFVVTSGNGAADFSYSELIRFGNKDGVLTLESLLYKYETYDVDSGETTGDTYKIKGKSADAAAYKAAYDAFYASAEDTGFDAQGVLTWESNFDASYAGFMSMTDKALSLYDGNFNS